MKFTIGQWEVTVNLFGLDKPRFEMLVSTDQENLKVGLSISYWHGAENPLVIKGEVKTEDKSHAQEST